MITIPATIWCDKKDCSKSTSILLRPSDGYNEIIKIDVGWYYINGPSTWLPHYCPSHNPKKAITPITTPSSITSSNRNSEISSTRQILGTSPGPNQWEVFNHASDIIGISSHPSGTGFRSK